MKIKQTIHAKLSVDHTRKFHGQLMQHFIYFPLFLNGNKTNNLCCIAGGPYALLNICSTKFHGQLMRHFIIFIGKPMQLIPYLVRLLESCIPLSLYPQNLVQPV